AAIFGAVCILQSVHQGQLSVPITWDDSTYFFDAAWRLQGLYDKGFGEILRGYLASPPHSPIASFNVLLGFLFLGMVDWAPAVINVVWLATLLVVVRR